jgi:uncharacterized protein (DUF433 family)
MQPELAALVVGDEGLDEPRLRGELRLGVAALLPEAGQALAQGFGPPLQRGELGRPAASPATAADTTAGQLEAAKEDAAPTTHRGIMARGALPDEVRAMEFRRITVDPRQMGGVPCLRGLRIPVATVVGMVADGMSEDDILQAYPDLEREDIREALRYAAAAVQERELPLLPGR